MESTEEKLLSEEEEKNINELDDIDYEIDLAQYQKSLNTSHRLSNDRIQQYTNEIQKLALDTLVLQFKDKYHSILLLKNNQYVKCVSREIKRIFSVLKLIVERNKNIRVAIIEAITMIRAFPIDLFPTKYLFRIFSNC